MNGEIKNCSNLNHKENNAKNYCHECKIYMCNKCIKNHSELFQDHHTTQLDEDITKIFTGFCKEKNHFDILKFFCKNHNQLCCTACITKIKGKEYGQHTDCDICIIEDIKNEKKALLKENIKNLDNLSNNIQELINNLKILFEEINKNKEDSKNKIIKIFTKIRSELNDREEELLKK